MHDTSSSIDAPRTLKTWGAERVASEPSLTVGRSPRIGTRRKTIIIEVIIILLIIWWTTIGFVRMDCKLKDSHRSFGRRSSDLVTPSPRCTTNMSTLRMVHPSVRCAYVFQNIHHAQHFRLDTTQPMEKNYKAHARKQHTWLLHNTVIFLKKTLSTPLLDSNRYLIRWPHMVWEGTGERS